MFFRSDFFKKISKKQLFIPNFLPKIQQHVTDNIVYYDNGYFAFAFQLNGFNFEGVDENILYQKYKILNHTLMTFGKNFLGQGRISSIVRRRKAKLNQHYEFANQFVSTFAEKYIQKINYNDCFINDFFLIFLIEDSNTKLGLKKATEQIQILQSSLADFSPRLLSVYKQRGIIFSELYDLFSSLINLSDEKIPLSIEAAFKNIPIVSLHFGNNLIEIRDRQSRKWAQAFDLRDFGLSQLKILTPVLSLPFEFNLVHNFTFIKNTKILSIVNKQLNELESVNDKAFFQQKELVELQGQVTSGNINFGTLRSSLLVIGDSPEQAIDNCSKAYAKFLESGGYRYQKAGWSAPATYFSQIIGSDEIPRPLTKPITNFSHIAFPYDYSVGKKENNPLGDGSAVIPLLTDAKTPYFFNFHYTENTESNQGKPVVGHTIILGKSETGKSTLLNGLLAFLTRFNPCIFALDLDQGMEIFIRAIGGQYFELKIGQSTGMNPFKLAPTQKNIDFLISLIEMCVGEEVNAEEALAIKEAVESILNSIDYEKRDFTHFVQNIPLKQLRQKLQQWQKGERFGWVFDNVDNIYVPEEFEIIGFDLTEILRSDENNYPPTQPVLAYMLHLREGMMQKVAKNQRFIATVIEEFWFATKYPKIADEIKKILKSERKRHNFAVLISQSPADAIRSSIFEAIIEQTATKIFLPNPSAEYVNSYERCGISETEFNKIIHLPEKSRKFLIKQGHNSAIANFNLKGFEEELNVLSGTSANVEILHKILHEYGHDPNDWLDQFLKKTVGANNG